MSELQSKIGKSKTKEENLKMITLDLRLSVNSLDDLRRNKGEIKESLARELKALESKYQLALSLVTGLYLFERFLELER